MTITLYFCDCRLNANESITELDSVSVDCGATLTETANEIVRNIKKCVRNTLDEKLIERNKF